MSWQLDIVEETADLLVLNKPAGLVCHPTKGDEYSSLISRARGYLGKDTVPRMINRLDRETSGLVLVAKSQAYAGKLGAIFSNRRVTKIYSAIVEGWVERDAWTIDAALGKDENSVVAIRDWVREDGVTSQTQVEAVKRFMRGGERFTVCRVKPLTGRKHQIRIHLAWAGHSIVGDKLYGPDERLYLRFIAGELSDREREEILRTPHHALHCGLLSWDEPSGEKRFEAVAEAWFREFGQV